MPEKLSIEEYLLRVKNSLANNFGLNQEAKIALYSLIKFLSREGTIIKKGKSSTVFRYYDGIICVFTSSSFLSMKSINMLRNLMEQYGAHSCVVVAEHFSDTVKALNPIQVRRRNMLMRISMVQAREVYFSGISLVTNELLK